MELWRERPSASVARTFVPKTLNDDVSGSITLNKSRERLNRLPPGRYKSIWICQYIDKASGTYVIDLSCVLVGERYLFGFEDNPAASLVSLFSKYGDVHVGWSLVMIDPTISKLFHLKGR